MRLLAPLSEKKVASPACDRKGISSLQTGLRQPRVTERAIGVLFLWVTRVAYPLGDNATHRAGSIQKSDINIPFLSQRTEYGP